MSCILRFLTLAVLLGLISCASNREPRGPIVDITPEQVQKSNDMGLLRSLQVTLRAALVDKSQEDFRFEYELLHDIDVRLASLVQERALKVIDGKRITVEEDAESVVPLPDIAKVNEQILGDESLTPEYLPKVLTPIEQEEQLTNKQIEHYKREAQKSKLGPTRRAEVYHYIYLLNGKPHWKKVRDQQMDVLLEPIRAAAARGSYSRKLEKKVDFVRRIYRNQPRAVVTEMLGNYATIYANRYFYKVNRDDLDGAHKVIVDLSNKADFNLIIEKLRDHRSKMVSAFAAKVDRSLAYPERATYSYDLLVKLIDINRILNASYDTDNRARKLAEQLYDQYQELNSQGEHTVALGVLYAIYNVYPNFGGVIGRITAEESLVYKSAIARLEVKKLYARPSRPQATAIAKSVESYLRGALPYDVVVTDGSASGEVVGSLAQAQPLEIAGNILQVKVEATSKPIKKTLEVTTGQNSIPNPDFSVWSDLPAKQRKGIEKPQETILVDRRENVAIGAQLHRKTGVFATSFRLLDSASKDVVYADSITLQREYQDESNTVFEVGDTVIPAKEASLPDDESVINEMATEMASKMGQKLEEKLRDREELYLIQANKAAKNKHCRQEVEYLAKGLTILRAKGKDIDEISKRLREQTMACMGGHAVAKVGADDEDIMEDEEELDELEGEEIVVDPEEL